MNSEIIELKRKYNALLERNRKAEEFLNKATPEQFEKWQPEFNKITIELSLLMVLIPGMTKDQIIKGFKDV